MLVTFNIKNDNETDRIPCLSTHATISNYAIGLVGHFLKISSIYPSLKWNNNNDRRKVRWNLVMFNIKKDNKTYRIPCLSTH